MADGTKIEWTDATWQIVTGCSVVSPGCTNCYAMKLAGTRLRHHPSRQGLTVPSKAGPVWNGMVRFNVGWLTQPLKWSKPRDIFVAAHGDLFHDGVQDWMLVKVFAVMAIASRHRFQVLTKRAERMRKFVTWLGTKEGFEALEAACRELGYTLTFQGIGLLAFPLPNVWLGVSTEDQERADERIPHLLATPAVVRWISAEPLLGAVDLRHLHVGNGIQLDALTGYHSCSIPTEGIGDAQSKLAQIPILPVPKGRLNWVVAGGESGPGARPCHPDWARALRDRCTDVGVPFFWKQWGAWLPGENYMLERPCEPAKWQDGQIGIHSTVDIDADDDKGPEWRHFTTPGEPGAFALRVGKKAAGAMLDGRLWREMPT